MELVAQMQEMGFWPADDKAVQSTVAELSCRFSEPRALARELIQRDLLTPYQANQLLTGKGQTLVIGRYLILDRIGEGGMGKVYKARHRQLHRIVALKIINPERLGSKQAVERFHREIQAISRLQHPNIVWAFDADQAGGNTFFAMQYVPGQDLQRMVKQSGPLDVARACDFIRQAALGLQHIADNGMIHRDIKPSNLLIVNLANQPSKAESGVLGTALKTDLVKIVDLGLTRLTDSDDSATSLTALTHDNLLMGTPDYIAPEQARQGRSADIRSDIYSLGCTLYFAIAGRPPFGGASAVQKIMHHQLDEAEPLEKVRPGIPQALSIIVRRMMAKQPEERYQTPQEVATALETVMSGQIAPVAAPLAVPATPVSEALKQTRSLFQFDETEVTPLVSSKSAPRLPSQPSWQKWLWIWVAGAAAAVFLVLLLLIKLLSR
jgi:serine/threonine protein kinase